MGAWTTIESDPGVFTELIRELGVEGVLVEEIYDLSEESFARLKPIYGLIFLFNLDNTKAEVDKEAINKMFFAKQEATNACATQAILGILMNREEIKLGELLTNFKNFTKNMSPTMKGIAISDNDKIREVHNSFRTQEPFVSEEKVYSKDDAFHFVSYVPVNGSVMEIDGLREGPVNHGECTEQNWLSKVKPVIEKRIAGFQSSEIRFNLMAVVKDPMEEYQKEMKETCQLIHKYENDPEKADELSVAKLRKQQVLDEIHNHEEKLKRYNIENSRRKHNWLPLTLELLRILAKKDKLNQAITEAQEKTKKRREAKRQKLSQQKDTTTSK